jgi:hypothetical protein
VTVSPHDLGSMSHYLMQRITLDPGSGCWLWEGPLGNGYGIVSPRAGGSGRAHRASYETFVGAIPAGLMICHKCDVKACINPAHLYAGTAKNNFDDWVSRLGGGLQQGKPLSATCSRGHDLEKYRTTGKKAYCTECQNERRAIRRQIAGPQCTVCQLRKATVSGRCSTCYDFRRIHGRERPSADRTCPTCCAPIAGKVTKVFCSKKCRNGARRSLTFA